MDLGKSSRPVITVAPVVVNPETDSNTASVMDSDGASANNSGKDPNALNTSQNKAVIKKPSRVRNVC